MVVLRDMGFTVLRTPPPTSSSARVGSGTNACRSRLSMLTGVCHLKHMRHRVGNCVRAHLEALSKVVDREGGGPGLD